ncbi:hypothetical protein LAB1_22690 [Roseibium sp. LAB1]
MPDTSLSPEDVKTLTRLEESLWRADTRYDPVLMDRILRMTFSSLADPAVSTHVKT